MIPTTSALLLALASLSAPAPIASQQGARRSVAPPPAGGDPAVRAVPRDLSLTGLGHDGGLQSPPGIAPLTRSVGCLEEIKDLASGSCVTVSSTPVLGTLYPLGPELNVDPTGNVGIGTTTPSSKLEVAGAARINGTLTLAPSGDQALDLSTGSVYKGGALFMHTKGTANTAVGSGALSNTTLGTDSTAVGSGALYDSTHGRGNTAVGKDALRSTGLTLPSGYYNTAVGLGAAKYNWYGKRNTAVGAWSLLSDTTGSGNTAVGTYALLTMRGSGNTSVGSASMRFGSAGNRNVAVGFRAGIALAGDDNIAIGNEGVFTDNDTIRIGTAGTHTRAFLAGVRSTTTGLANAIPVMVDSNGQLGTVSSSRRTKEDVRDMGTRTARLLELRPVVFRYKQHVQAAGDSTPVEYGLIAEEVAEVFPELVVRDEAGEPATVKYHLLSSMLLNELQELHERSETLRRDTRRELEELRARLAELEGRN